MISVRPPLVAITSAAATRLALDVPLSRAAGQARKAGRSRLSVLACPVASPNNKKRDAFFIMALAVPRRVPLPFVVSA